MTTVFVQILSSNKLTKQKVFYSIQLNFIKFNNYNHQTKKRENFKKIKQRIKIEFGM